MDTAGTVGIKSVLEIQDLRVYYRTMKGLVRAVDGVNLKIKKGEVVGLVGESGCGKSTTAFAIMNLLPKEAEIFSGKIIFKGVNLLLTSERELAKIRGKKISMIFQDPSSYLNPVLKIGDQMAEVIADANGGKDALARNRIVDQLTLLRIPSPGVIVNRYPHELSIGMQQRVLIATALMPKPDLIIADEPTTALDVTVQCQVLQLINELVHEVGCSLLLITHDLGIVAEACDTVYVMYAGKIVESADVVTLYETPLHPYTIGLLESVLSIDEFRERVQTMPGSAPNLINPPSGCRFHPRCKFAMEICVQKEPPTIDVGHGHSVSCWLIKKRSDL